MARNDEDEVETLNLDDGDESADERDEGEEEEQEEQEDRGDDLGEPSAEELEAVAAEEESEGDEEGDGKSGKPASVPYGRFKEVNDELKVMRDRLAQLEGRVSAKPEEKKPEEKEKPFDFDASEEEYAKAVLEGDMDKARAIRRDIRAAEKAEAVRAADERIAEAEAAREAREAERLAARTAAEIVAKYPLLDHKSEGANPEAITMVVGLRDSYIRAGEPVDKAMRKASDRVAKLFGWTKTDEAAPSGGKPPAQPLDRRARAVERNAQIEKRIPAAPATSGSGGSASRPNVEKMTDSEFNSLSDAEKRRLRGD